MAFNRFRIYDILQRSVVTVLVGTTVLGGAFVSANIYNNWVEKRKLDRELALKASIGSSTSGSSTSDNSTSGSS